jgi:hypothetical protein
VTAAEVARIASTFERTWQRPPTGAELDGLVEEYVREEVLYREGIAAGLDRDDAIVRRRVAQKMEFLAEEFAPSAPPTEAELGAWLRDHPGPFRVEGTVTFRQVCIGRDRRGASAEADARAVLARLAAGESAEDPGALGDSRLLPVDVGPVPPSEVAASFGEGFEAAIRALEPGRWGGPIGSGFGLHLVLVRERTEGRLPALAEVREEVEREWTSARRKAALEEVHRRLRAKYEIVIERPGTGGAR